MNAHSIIASLNDALDHVRVADRVTKRVNIEIDELLDAEEHIKGLINEIKTRQGHLTLIDCPFQVDGSCDRFGCLLNRDPKRCDDTWYRGLKAASALDGGLDESDDL